MRIGQVSRLLVLCGVVMVPGLQAIAAVNAYMTFDAKDEKMKGDPSRASSPERIHLISVPQDAQSGMATGKRMHKPFTITKEVDAASPMLKQAQAKGSVLGDVTIVFEGATGTAKTAQKIVLTNALITGIQMVGKTEQITLDYQTIEVTYVNGGKSATDDWESPK